jgi:hypothetical protein
VYRDQVACALRAAVVRSATRYAWLGRLSHPLPVALEDEMSVAERRVYLAGCLREELYASFYCPGRVVPARWGEPQPVAPDRDLEDALSGANAGCGSWEPGWTIERLEGDHAVVASARLRSRVPLVECRPANGRVAAGARVSIRLPKELPSLSPGFFTVVGDAIAGEDRSLVRVYWHISCAGAPKLVRALTTMLNAARTPFRLKVGDHPARLDRCDGAVLYLRPDGFGEQRCALGRLARELAPHLHSEVPAFTLPLAPGVGLAEDDAADTSFGMRRCVLLADAIVDCHERRIVDLPLRLDAVAARFARDGVDLDAPYLEPAFDGRHAL